MTKAADDVLALKLDKTYRGAVGTSCTLLRAGKTKFGGGGH
jgi:hypothetical protein